MGPNDVTNQSQAETPSEAELEQWYLANGGVRCPYCGSDDLVVSDSDGAGVVTSRVTCADCWKEWFEHRKLVGFEVIKE